MTSKRGEFQGMAEKIDAWFDRERETKNTSGFRKRRTTRANPP